jgi:hypothetical protein
MKYLLFLMQMGMATCRNVLRISNLYVYGETIIVDIYIGFRNPFAGLFIDDGAMNIVSKRLDKVIGFLY